MADSSKVSIYAAMAANVGIAIAKFVGASIGGSSAMLAEGFHSVVDSANEVLLLYGLKRSEIGPDERHPLGHGQELYFWSLVVAVLIFSMGGGFSIYEGIHSFENPEPSSNATISYAVLAIAAVFEGAALVVSVREFNKERPENIGFIKAIRRSKDPSRFIVIFEDAAALLGLLIAFTGVFLSQYTGNAMYDGIASIIIGTLLIGVATVLVLETKGLLIGESALPEVQQSIYTIVESDEAVTKAEPPITLHLGPKDIMVALNIEFEDELTSDQIEIAVIRIESAIRETHPDVRRIFVEAASMRTTKPEMELAKTDPAPQKT
ncbi:MAG: cation diffusion facilitator family transporter [Elainellaceae cyanobacterium]